MAQFRATPDDFDEVIRSQQWRSLRRQAPYPLAALLATLTLSFIHRPTALVTAGMCVAWSVSTFLDWRSIRSAYLWRHAWAQEDVAIDIGEEGIQLSNQRGSGFIRWNSGAIVRSRSSCFVLEEEGEEIAVIPKRYLTASELLILHNRASSGAAAPNKPLQPTSGAGASG